MRTLELVEGHRERTGVGRWRLHDEADSRAGFLIKDFTMELTLLQAVAVDETSTFHPHT